MNGLTLDITVKTDVELLLEGQLIKVIFQKKKINIQLFLSNMRRLKMMTTFL